MEKESSGLLRRSSEKSTDICKFSEDRLSYPVYFFNGDDGNFDYVNAEFEMIDVEISSSDEEVSLSDYDIVQIDEYQIQNEDSSSSQRSIQTNVVNYGWKISIKDLDRTIAELQPFLECVLCKRSWSNYSSLEQHFRLIHPRVPCHIICCGLKWNNRPDIIKHLRNHVNVSKNVHMFYQSPVLVHIEELDSFIENFIPNLKCPLCEKVHSKHSELKRHFKVQHPDQECHIVCCQRKWAGQLAVLEHIRVHLDRDIYRCRFCEKFFLTKQSLHRHYRAEIPSNSRDADRPIKVGQNNTLVRKTYIDIDIYIAQWRPRLECSICSTLCLNFKLLEFHFAEFHPNEQCHVICCERQFKTRSRLEEHINLHSNPLSYKCQLCKEWHVSSSDLYSHMVKQHPLPLSEVDEDNVDETNQEIPPQLNELRRGPRTSHTIDELIAFCDIRVECVECGKLCANYTMLKGHYFCCHPDKSCYLLCCQLVLDSTAAITYHLKTHVLRYNQNGKDIHKRELLKRKHEHYDNIVARWKPRLQCWYCHNTYLKYTLLKKHFYKDHPTEMCYVVCCELKLSGLQLVDHAYFHKDRNAFKCKLCEYCPPTKLAFFEHMRLEHAERFLKQRYRSKSQIKRMKTVCNDIEKSPLAEE